MKNTLTLSLFLTVFFLVVIMPTNVKSSENLILNGDQDDQLIMKTSNGCGIFNFFIPSTGDSSQGAPPLLGKLSLGSQNSYKILDTIPGTQIKGVAFKRRSGNPSIIDSYSSYPYVIVSDSGLFSYDIEDGENVKKNEQNSIFIPGIIKMARQIKTEPIVLMVKDDDHNYEVRVFSFPDLQEQFSFDFHFEPEIFELSSSSLFLSGKDTSGDYTLYEFSSSQDTLYNEFTLNDSASNAKEILKIRDSIFVLSSPGDTITVLSTINSTNGAFSQNIINTNSGARATHNKYKYEQYFTFQPIEDTMSSNLDKQILALDPVTGQTDTLMLNKRFDKFKYPPPYSRGFGQFSMGWIGAHWRNGSSDSIFISSYYNPDDIQVQTQTGAFPQYINATYDCSVGLSDNETERISFDVYPNPASSETILSLTGLQKGREYKLTITDISGKVYYNTDLKAYQEYTLPLQMLSKGMYLLNLHTGDNTITERLLVQ